MRASSAVEPGRRGARGVPVVEAHDLKRVYEVGRGLFRAPSRLQAVGGISFAVEPGRTLAVVGESGCGKSTLARMVTLIEKPTAGTLTLDGTDAVNPPAARGEAPAPDRAVRVPEPLRLAQSAQEGRHDPRGAAGDQHRPSAAERTAQGAGR